MTPKQFVKAVNENFSDSVNQAFLQKVDISILLDMTLETINKHKKATQVLAKYGLLEKIS